MEKVVIPQNGTSPTNVWTIRCGPRKEVVVHRASEQKAEDMLARCVVHGQREIEDVLNVQMIQLHGWLAMVRLVKLHQVRYKLSAMQKAGGQAITIARGLVMRLSVATMALSVVEFSCRVLLTLWHSCA